MLVLEIQSHGMCTRPLLDHLGSSLFARTLPIPGARGQQLTVRVRTPLARSPGIQLWLHSHLKNSLDAAGVNALGGGLLSNPGYDTVTHFPPFHPIMRCRRKDLLAPKSCRRSNDRSRAVRGGQSQAALLSSLPCPPPPTSPLLLCGVVPPSKIASHSLRPDRDNMHI